MAVRTRRELKSIGNYDLIEKIGKGGMGTVYRGLNRTTGSTVAVKVLAADVSEDTKLFDRFLQEFQSAGKLDHPNVVRALDFGRDAGKAYLVMELVEGRSLSAIIEEEGALPEETAVRIVTQVAQALHYAHRRRIIHRDVKPDNVLIRNDGLAKLADFGLAKDFSDDQGLTKPLTGLGTPHFMAPEQYEDAKNAGVLCDVYSLGATLYCAVTGQLPFSDCATLVALTRKIKGDIPPPRAIVPELTLEVDDAIRRAMSPDPQNRPATIFRFIKLLAASRKGPKSFMTPPPRTGKLVARPAKERRAAVRHVVTLPGSCVIDTSAVARGHDTEEDWPATVQDVSATGLGLVLARRFEPGTLFSVEIAADATASARSMHVRVARVLPRSHGHWFHGCAFVDQLEDSTLRQLVR